MIRVTFGTGGSTGSVCRARPTLTTFLGFTTIVRAACEQHNRVLLTTQRGPYPHTDDGVEVRRVFHQLRSLAIENFNEVYKSLFAVGLLLFLITLCMNVVSQWFVTKFREEYQ